MNSKKVVIFITLFLIIVSIFAEKKVVRIENPTSQVLELFRNQKWDIASINLPEYIDLVVSKDDEIFLTNSEIEFKITQTETQLSENLSISKDLGLYHTYEETLEQLQLYEAQYPNICKLYDIGDSWGKIYYENGNAAYQDFNHEIWAIKVSDNVEIEEDEPCIYYLGEHHAREPISLEVVLAILDHTLMGYNDNTQITDNVNNSQIWFVPLVNPNGHKVVTDETNLWWRKNTRDNNENGIMEVTDANGIDGVDPNRNYSWEWGLTGSSDDWYSIVYHGPYPFSEPEVEAVKNLIESHHFIAGITYHSYSELVLFPFGYANGVNAPDRDALEELAISMAITISADGTASGHYTPQSAWELYPCMGTTDDYSYGEHGIFSFTVELGTQFIPPDDQIEEISQENIEAAMILMNRMNQSIVLGHITDANTNEPVIATIYVDGVDDTGVFRKPYKSDELGTYYRFLPVGNYDITVSAFGYENFSTNVIITSDQQTVLDIPLNPAATVLVSGMIIDGNNSTLLENVQIDLYPHSATEPVETIYSTPNGQFIFADIPAGNYQIKYSLENFTTFWAEYTFESDQYLTIDLFTQNIIGFEENEFTEMNSEGDVSWFVDNSEFYEGANSIRSGSITGWSSSGVSITVEVENNAEITFYKKVSTENGYDFFTFFIDGVNQGQWSGEMDWSLSTFEVSAGEHTFKWLYEKDGYVDEGSDCVWLDNISIPGYGFNASDFNPPQYLEVEHTYTFPDNFYNLSWQTPETSESTLIGYNVYATFNQIAQVEANITTYYGVDLPGDEEADVYIFVTALYENPDGESVHSNIVTCGIATESPQNQTNFITSLKNNYPNPFNPETEISFSLADQGKVKISIYNIKGQKIKTLIYESLPIGEHSIVWNGKDSKENPVSSGVYFYRMKTSQYQKINKMLLLK
ncbi:MAG: carboxypeptidase regulatory-like domain-containing protein [Candidatus Cloacimonetes bacterium]|nr:carboxypeptidase regulatory-like domain-containing protein [Candidatus Cloacimonadota bacterium]